MPAPLAPLYIDVPGIGTARVWWRIVGDQFDENFSNLYEECDWRAAGETVWENIDEANSAALVGEMAQPVPKIIGEILSLSGYPVGASPRTTVESFLGRSRAEIDAMVLKWAREKVWPRMGAWLKAILGQRLGSASSPVAGYANVEEALNAVWASARVTLVDGNATVTAK